jgi:RNA polymerase sigma-70 factor, ECF subfamily
MWATAPAATPYSFRIQRNQALLAPPEAPDGARLRNRWGEPQLPCPCPIGRLRYTRLGIVIFEAWTMARPMLPSRFSSGPSKLEAGSSVQRLSTRGKDRGETDSILMERVRDEDQRAFRLLVERYMHPLAVYVAGLVEGLDAADDVVQMTFIRLWQHRRDWTGSGSVKSYLFKIARNLALNARRDRGADLRRQEGFRQTMAGSPGPPTPADELAVGLLRKEVEAAIGKLPERRREVFVLMRFHGLSHREVGEVLGISPQTVANQMHAALEELRVALRHHLR